MGLSSNNAVQNPKGSRTLIAVSDRAARILVGRSMTVALRSYSASRALTDNVAWRFLA